MIECRYINIRFTQLRDAFKYFLSVQFPDSLLRASIEWLPVHRVLGVSAFAFTAMAILTGIMDKLSFGACFYTGVGDAEYS